MKVIEAKLANRFSAGIEEGIKELKSEVKAVTTIEKNYGISIHTGEI
jgi:hypothetical protein